MKVHFGVIQTVMYTNHEGKTAKRSIIPRLLRYGATAWHLEPQWLLEVWDVDKGAERTFALKDMKPVTEGANR